MADGLHIQRYFLDTRPRKVQRIERLAAARGVTTEALAEIRQVVPDGLLEHLFDPRQPVPLQVPLEGLRFSEMTTTVAGAAVLLVLENACVPGATPLIDRTKLPSAATAKSASFSDAVMAVLATSGVDYLFQLNTRVLVEVGPNASEELLGDAFQEDDALLETVVVQASGSPYAYAEDLAARSAARFWFSFLFSRPNHSPPPERTWPSPWSKQKRGTYALCTEITAKAVRYRMRDRISRLAPDLMTKEELASYRTSLEPLKKELLTQEDFVDRIEMILAEPNQPVPSDNNMDVGDILCTLFPGKNQFHKYWKGGAAGQAE